MSKVSIRKVKIGDEEILAYIQTESWKEGFKTILSKETLDRYTNIDKARKMYKELLKNNIGNGYILSVNDKPHCIAYWDKEREIGKKDCAELICIHSLLDNWGQGYGSIMIEKVLKEIEELNFNEVVLWVFEDNKRARKCYEKNGFKITENIKESFGAIEVMYSKVLKRKV